MITCRVTYTRLVELRDSGHIDMQTVMYAPVVEGLSGFVCAAALRHDSSRLFVVHDDGEVPATFLTDFPDAIEVLMINFR